jgi:hypothetical protein
LTLGSKLRHEVAERAIAITELPSYLGQRAMVEKDGSKRLEASVKCRPGTSEEVVAASVIHGVSSRIVTEFFRDSTPRGDAISHRAGKIRPGGERRKRLNFLRWGEDGSKRDRSWPEKIAGQHPLKSTEKQVTVSRKNRGKRPGKSRIDRGKCHRFFFRGFRRSRQPRALPLHSDRASR